MTCTAAAKCPWNFSCSTGRAFPDAHHAARSTRPSIQKSATSTAVSGSIRAGSGGSDTPWQVISCVAGGVGQSATVVRPMGAQYFGVAGRPPSPAISLRQFGARKSSCGIVVGERGTPSHRTPVTCASPGTGMYGSPIIAVAVTLPRQTLVAACQILSAMRSAS